MYANSILIITLSVCQANLLGMWLSYITNFTSKLILDAVVVLRLLLLRHKLEAVLTFDEPLLCLSSCKITLFTITWQQYFDNCLLI